LSAVHDAAVDPRWLDGFLDLPSRVYGQHPACVLPPRGEALAALQRPDLVKPLAGVADDSVVARLVAQLSPELCDGEGRPLGLIGFFEALEGYETAVGELFRQGIAWLRRAGAGPIVGPMDGDTWHRYRLNVGPFDDPPFLLEPCNPPYYEPLWTVNGFVPRERYHSKQVDPAAVVRHLEEKRRAAPAVGYRLRSLDPARFRDELRTIYELSREIFSRNFLYTEIPEEEFYGLYAGARGLIDPDFVLFAQAPSGEDIGFLFAYPDRGAVDFKTLGVLPQHRRAGVAVALFHEGHRRAVEKGYRVANHCLYREGNPSGELDGGAGRVIRTYVLYEYSDAA
jgi:GNAT superfamily N-acetyltransferase